MKYSDDLFQLIQSLSQSEKRYVKLYAQAFSSKGTENQIDLLDAFERQEHYDEAEIRESFKDRIRASNFHVAKNRLYNLILRALQLFHAKESVQEKLHQLISQGDILRRKNLFDQAKTLFEKALDFAHQENEYALGFIAEQHLYNLHIELRDMKAVEAQHEASAKRRQYFLKNLEQISNFQEVESRMLVLTHRYQNARTEEQLAQLATLEKHPLLQLKESEFNRVNLRAFYFLNAFIARFKGDYSRACHFAEKLLVLAESENPLSRKHLNLYVGRLNNLMFLSLEAHLFEKAEQNAIRLWEFQHLPFVVNDRSAKFKILERCMEFWLEYYLVQNHFAEGLIFIQQHEEELQEVLSKTGSLRQLVMQLSLTQLYLSNGLLEKTAEHLDICLHHPNLKSFEHVFAGVMTMNLLLHFELKNYQLLESLVLNTYRTMRKRKLLYQSEKVLLRHLRRLLRPGSERERNDLFCRLKRELKDARENPLERSFLDAFDLCIWLESKRTGVSMAQYLEEGGEGFFPTCST